MQLNGENESFALLPIDASPPPSTAFAGLGRHAIAFSGEVNLDVEDVREAVRNLKDGLDDRDSEFEWDLDITVGPRWREVRTAAPLVVVTDIHSWGADEDDNFQAGLKFRTPRWSAQGVVGEQKIVLHVTLKQAGDSLTLRRLGYSVTATGQLRDPVSLVPPSE